MVNAKGGWNIVHSMTITRAEGIDDDWFNEWIMKQSGMQILYPFWGISFNSGLGEKTVGESRKSLGKKCTTSNKQLSSCSLRIFHNKISKLDHLFRE